MEIPAELVERIGRLTHPDLFLAWLDKQVALQERYDAEQQRWDDLGPDLRQRYLEAITGDFPPSSAAIVKKRIEAAGLQWRPDLFPDIDKVDHGAARPPTAHRGHTN